MARTVNLTPSWTACVRGIVAVLRNAEAAPDVVEDCLAELMRLAHHVDRQQHAATGNSAFGEAGSLALTMGVIYDETYRR